MAAEIDPQTVRHIAHLSRLKLSEEQCAAFGGELASILTYMQTLSEVDTEGVAPTAHPLAIRSVFREDTPRPSLPPEAALANAPAKAAACFKVPKVLEQESV